MSGIEIGATAARLKSGSLSLTKLADGSGVLLDLAGLQVLSLNETAVFIVEAVTLGESSVDVLAARMSTEFDVAAEVALGDIEELIETLRALTER